MASVRKKSSSRSRSGRAGNLVSGNIRSAPERKAATVRPAFAVCVRNKGYPASLELRKIYRVLPDAFGEQHGFLRVVDESGEDYLFPSDYFVAVDLPASLRQKLRRIA